MTTHLLTGDDESILRAAVVALVDELVGDGDRSMTVDEFDGDEYELRAVVDAAQTPPFLSE
jgi:DNA polymerase-3 subunit delta